jgi:hypothetical protein
LSGVELRISARFAAIWSRIVLLEGMVMFGRSQQRPGIVFRRKVENDKQVQMA